jgi:hypothetical protein
MADIDIPDDILQLRRRFLAADAAWAESADLDTAQRAYEDAGRLAEQIQDHDWWGTVDDKFKARMALIAAAKV